MLSTMHNLNKSKSLVTTYKKNFVGGAFRKIKRHFDALLAPTHVDYTSAVVDTNTAMYTYARQFQASPL